MREHRQVRRARQRVVHQRRREQLPALVERLVDEAARATGRDPVELRRLNMVRRDAFPYRTALGYLYDSGDFQRLMDEARG